MNLRLDHIIPIPLREKVASHHSMIWNKELSFAPGEYIFVQAPSGTGKTTLVHILYGLRSDMQGHVRWDNKQLPGLNATALSQLRTSDASIIFQDLRLFPELTAWENLELKRSLPNTVSAATVEQWLERLGMSAKRNSLASTLSYGERQRIAIIRALLQPFKWLLMDEPFSHLDNANIAKAAALIQEVVAANNAGLLLADLEDNDHFNYTTKLVL
jgi:putative ABC transport system ATP-binding protein